MSKRIVACLLAVMLLLANTASASAALAWGSTGEQVRQVQQKLKQWGYYDGSVDGVYGQGTYNAVIKFQRKNGLTADGVIGDSTAAAIGISLKSGSSGGTTAQPSRGQNTGDVNLLARLIHGEARGEPYLGKVAVAAVVLNRVRHPSFPNTIAGVIYQAGAFDAVADGQINLAPDADSLRAARDAMNGWDPTGGCLYYYNPSTATAAWIWTRKIQMVIGRHNFAI